MQRKSISFHRNSRHISYTNPPRRAGRASLLPGRGKLHPRGADGRIRREKPVCMRWACPSGRIQKRGVQNGVSRRQHQSGVCSEKIPGAAGLDEKIAHTLTASSDQGTLEPLKRIRRLTPRECLRLQGWADERIDIVLPLQSDAQLYKQAGNGVTVTVVEAIGKRLAAAHREVTAID